MPIELRHLRYFIAVAQEGHITRAAERLGMQQPPLSQQIKILENLVGVQLFHRKARGVELTDAGRAFFDDVTEIFECLERSVETARRTARGEEGSICVGVTPTAPFHPLVQRAIRSFRQTYPKVTLTMEEGLSHDLLRLQNDRIDVAFVRNAVAEPEGLTVIKLLEEPMVVALPTGHGLVCSDHEQGVLLKHLSKEPFILYGPPGSGIYDATIAACHRAGFNLLVGQLAPRITSALGLVAAGFGISLVPKSISSVGMNGVAYRPLKGSPQPMAVLNLVSRKGDPSAAVRHFLEVVRSSALDMHVIPTR